MSAPQDPPFPHQKKKRLRDFSTFGIGGPALYFAEAYSKEHMQEMLVFAYLNGLPIHILGKGSNTLFDDRGFNGLVILNRIDFLQQEGSVFKVGSGFSFARLGGITARSGWEGLEFASGIPATVGGAIYMNAGAGGRQIADVLTEVAFISPKGDLLHFKKDELEFGYRFSSFQVWKGGAIVEGSFCLSPSKKAKARQKEHLDYRLKTQPYGEKSAGCVFRNPHNDSAGRLIESAGLKGLKIGGAAISEAHANFIVNTGNASAQDVLDLIKCVKDKIFQNKGISLQEEIRYIPYDV